MPITHLLTRAPRRYVQFHQLHHPIDMDEAEIRKFLVHLAVNRQVSPGTLNQAVAALVFLYREILGRPHGSSGRRSGAFGATRRPSARAASGRPRSGPGTRIPRPAKSGGITGMSRPCSGRWLGRLLGAESPRGPAATPSAFLRDAPPRKWLRRSKHCSAIGTSTTMLYTYVLNRGGLGVTSPPDRAGLGDRVQG